MISDTSKNRIFHQQKKVITRSFTSLFNLSTINHYTVALWTFSQRPPVPFVHRTSGRCHHCELTSEFLIRSLHSARHNPPPCFLLDGVPIRMTSKFQGCNRLFAEFVAAKPEGRKTALGDFLLFVISITLRLGLKIDLKGPSSKYCFCSDTKIWDLNH